ncbi:MAG TPA: acyltransferase, partial [Acidimicrobiia bacterium]
MDATGESAHPAPRLRYEPALDGLRGFAVLAVMGYHARVGWLRGGFVGVDVFFVLSGYLITALLLAEHAQTGRIDTPAFWGRRARRLLPALLLLLLGVAGYVAFIAYSGDRGAIRADAVASLLYVQNWHLAWSGTSYFAAFKAPSPLRHLWSLAIEEQFYVVWPVALLVLLRVARGRRWVLAASIAVGAAASALLMAALYRTGHDPSRVYYGTDTRAQELLVGASLAVVLSRAAGLPAVVGRLLRWAGLPAAVAVVWVVTRAADSSTWLYRGGFLAVAVATAVVVATIVTGPAHELPRALGVAPLRATGRISYGLYLWHWPVYLVLDPDRTGLHDAGLLALRLAVTFAIAILSFVLVERPVRIGSAPIWQGRRLRVATVASVAAVVVAVSVTLPASTPAFVDTAQRAGPTLPPLPGPTSKVTTPHDRAVLNYLAVHDPSAWAPGDLTVEPDGHALADGVIFLPKLDRYDGRPHILMVGDSVLFTLAREFDPGPTSRADYYSYAQPGCAFLPGTDVDRGRVGSHLPSCALLQTRWRMLVDRRRPDLSFLYVGAFEVFDRLIDGHVYRVGTPAWADRLRAALTRDVDLFSSHGGLVALPTVGCYDPPDYGVAGVAGGATDRGDPRRKAAVDDVIRQVAHARPKVVR